MSLLPRSDPAPLRGAAAVVGDRCDVGDGRDLEAGGLQRADRLLATGARTLDVDLDLAHSVLHRPASGALGRQRRRVRRALPGALEAGNAGRAPADHRATEVGDRDDRVVERRLDMDVPLGDVLALTAALLDRLLAFGHLSVRSLGLLLPPHADRLLRSAPLTGVRLGSLAADRQVATMAHPSVRADLDEPLDVQRDLAAEVALHLVAPVDQLAEAVDLLLREVADAGVGVDVRLGQDLLGGGQADPEDVSEGDLDPLLAGNVDAGDACHRSALPLLVLGVGADDHHGAVATDDLAVVAARLDGSSDFQRILDSCSSTGCRSFLAALGRSPAAFAAYFRRYVIRPRVRS